MKSSYELARKAAYDRRNRAALRAANPNRLCPPDHRHGETTTCYTQHGCLCHAAPTNRQSRSQRGDYLTRATQRPRRVATRNRDTPQTPHHMRGTTLTTPGNDPKE